MKKTILFILFLLLFVGVPVAFGQVDAASFSFDKTTVPVSVDSTFDIQVQITTGTPQVNAADAYVTFDSTLLEAQTVTPGTFFPTVTNSITSGTVYISGIVNGPGQAVTGTGTLATITFKGKANGTATLSFDCQTSGGNTSKIVQDDVNATNILVCSENGTATVTVGIGSQNSTITPTGLPVTGSFDTMYTWTMVGTSLVLMGIALKLFIMKS